ncbi:MAG: WD40 repeat domain-containing protein [Anaerolineae bacterium]|nr:WD40 repeat domain-containing protein [Anaerolineae bacterium]
MNDDFLHNHRQPPRQDFAESLRQRLHEEDTHMTTEVIQLTTETHRTEELVQRGREAERQSANGHQPSGRIPRRVRADFSRLPAGTDSPGFKPRAGAWLTLALALAAMLALISLVIIGRTPPAGDPARASLPPLLPITAENATRVREITSMGKGNLHQVAYSPDGSLLALAGTRGVWLHTTADLTAPARLLEGTDTSFIKRVLAWSPDGSLLAMSDGDGTRVWNPVTGGVVTDLEYPTQVTALAFSPDGTELAVGGGAWDDPDGTTYPVQVWKTQTWQQDQTPVQLGGRVNALAFQPGEDGLLAIAFDLSAEAPTWSLMLMRTADKTMHRNEYFDEEGGQDLAFSPDGAVIYSNQRSRIVGWNVDTGEQVIESQASTNFTAYDLSLSINPAGTEIASASVNGGLKIWSLTGDTSRFQTSEVQTSLEYTTSVAYSPDGSQLVTLEYAGLVQVWDAQTGDEVASIRDYAGNISAVKLTPDQQQVFVADQTGTLRFYDVATEEEARRFETDATLYRDMADLSADGSLIAYSDLNIRVVGTNYQTQNQGVRLIDTLSGEVQTTLNVPDGVWGTVRFNPDRNQLLLTGTNGSRLWDLTLPGQYQTIFTRDTTSYDGAFSADGQILAFSDGLSNGIGLTIYDLLKPEQIYVGDYPDVNSAYGSSPALAWSPDGRTIALPINVEPAVPGYRLQLFDIESKSFTSTTSADAYLYDLVYSPDGSMLAVTVNGRVTLYDATTLDVLAELPQSAAYLVNFSADGSMLLTGGWDGIVRIWGVTE